MKKEIIIHIGNHKAGSTAIQMAFHKNNIIAEELFYPKAHKNSFVMHNHNFYAKSIGTDYEDEAMADLKEQILKSNKPKVVLSSAHYSRIQPNILDEHIKKYFTEIAENVKVVRYLRPALEYWKSLYVEMVKIGEVRSDFNSYYHSYNWKLPLYSDSIIEYNTQDLNITTRPLISSALHNGDAVEDFLYLCVGNNYKILNNDKVNVALSAQHLSVVKFMHAQFKNRNFDELRDDGYSLEEVVKKHVVVDNPVNFQIPKQIAVKIASDPVYIEDAKSVDALLTPGQTYMSDNLYSALEETSEDDISLNVEDWFSLEVIQAFKAWGEFAEMSRNTDALR